MKYGFKIKDGVLTSYEGQVLDSDDEVIIPEGVTAIGDRAFTYRRAIQRVSIPEGVTSIGEGAFFYCQTMESVSLPSTLTTIGPDAFALCENLKKIVIPMRVESIGDGAFRGCEKLDAYAECVNRNRPYPYCTDVQIEMLNGKNVMNNPSKFFVNDSFLIGKGGDDPCFYVPKEFTKIRSFFGIPSEYGSGYMPNPFASTYLYTVIIHRDVTEIDKNAFDGAYNSLEIIYEGTLAEWKALFPSWETTLSNHIVLCIDGAL